VLLTGHELLKKEILNEQVDVERAISLVLEVTQNIAGAKELMNVLTAGNRAFIDHIFPFI
jgi:hypothetical protein